MVGCAVTSVRDAVADHLTSLPRLRRTHCPTHMLLLHPPTYWFCAATPRASWQKRAPHTALPPLPRTTLRQHNSPTPRLFATLTLPAQPFTSRYRLPTHLPPLLPPTCRLPRGTARTPHCIHAATPATLLQHDASLPRLYRAGAHTTAHAHAAVWDARQHGSGPVRRTAGCGQQLAF